MCQPLIRYIVGDGTNTLLWLDDWHPLGQPHQNFEDNVVRNIGSSLLVKVSFIICNGDWSWPRQRNRSIMRITAHTPTFKAPLNQEDKVIWAPVTSQ